MDPEVKRLLEETHALVRDNHRMLRAIRFEAWLGFFARLIWWLFILGLLTYGYQRYLAPYLGSLPTASQIETLIQHLNLTR